MLAIDSPVLHPLYLCIHCTYNTESPSNHQVHKPGLYTRDGTHPKCFMFSGGHNQQYQWKLENIQSDKPVCLNFRLNYLGEIKWRDWATTVLFDRVWTLGDPCLWLTLWSAAADEDRSAARGMIPVTFIKISSTCKLWVLFHCPKQLIIISDLLPQWEWHFPRYCGRKIIPLIISHTHLSYSTTKSSRWKHIFTPV